MATYENIEFGSVKLGEILTNITIGTLSTLTRGLVTELMTPYINDFNKMNHHIMEVHMMRNAYENTITINNVGENAYTNGDSQTQATVPQVPSYTIGNNYYTDFVTNVRDNNKNGTDSTRINVNDGVENLYFDSKEEDVQIKYSSYYDKNSILFKTQRLLRLNKLKTIVSAFHTNGVNYVGQVGDKTFGESHGRNLLTKAAENGNGGYDIHGYDNPYCRVWTNHYKYDKLYKTMRANSQFMNYWPGFEWDNTDKGHSEKSSEYGDGENYDYAWRGKHNQDRRWTNSVLDPKTGLVKITPQYRNGGAENRHTKECMFSIENLAWKDYDPYSFEEALSWEQRGPFGGRIMWFPPYGLEVTETTNVKWNSNDFIGRGEPIYTYINTERTGNLSFLMLTDHPSSIDYASWWEDSNLVKNRTDTVSNSENDYLRYFAGCTNGDNENGNSENESKSVGLNLIPTPLTDEYEKPNPPLINLNPDGTAEDPNNETVEFFVFFPNNYSGILDLPANQNSQVNVDVNAIAYLLAGRNAQKRKLANGNVVDNPIDIKTTYFDKDEEYETDGIKFIGYEMGRGAVTTSKCDEFYQYIQGGKNGADVTEYIVDEDKKWRYRIDHKQPYTFGNADGTNTINQKVNKANLSDTKDNRTNFEVSGNTLVLGMCNNKEKLYSFAEVATALYSESILNVPSLCQYLINIGVNMENVNKLINLFNSSDYEFNSAECIGYATKQGPSEGNTALSTNRAKTIKAWLTTNTKWANEKITIRNDIKEVKDEDLSSVNGDSSKLYRCVHCILHFKKQNNSTDSENSDSRDIPGFKFVGEIPMPDGKVWTYYEKNGTINYFEQEVGSSDNYDKPDKDDVVVTEDQILNIFKLYWKPKDIQIIRENPRYRGEYNEYGMYITTFNYTETDNPNIRPFIDNQTNTFNKDEHLYYNEKFYEVLEDFTATNWSTELETTKLKDITRLMSYYNTGDIVLHDDVFYICKEGPDGRDFPTEHSRYEYNDFSWSQITTLNISNFIKQGYTFIDGTPSEKYKIKNIKYNDDEEVFLLCTKSNRYRTPDRDYNWGDLEYSEFEETPGEFNYEIGDVVSYQDVLYQCIDEQYYTDEFNPENWMELEWVEYSILDDYYPRHTVVLYEGSYYVARIDITQYEWTDDLRPALLNLVCDSEHQKGEFNGEHAYKLNECCFIPSNKSYQYCTDENISGRSLIPFDESEWELAPDDVIHKYAYGWELSALIEKAATILCWTIEKIYKSITGNAIHDVIDDKYSRYDCIWKYGQTNDLVTQEKVNVGVDLVSYAELCERTSLDGNPNNPISITQDEEKYLELLKRNNEFTESVDLQKIRQYIIMYRIFDGIQKIQNNSGTRNVCDTLVTSEDEMKEKSERKDESETEGCPNVWVDRGDGILIQECYIDYNGGIKPQGRFDAEKGKGEWNKLRYDQEYHFYKQWIVDHPLMYEKLQEKIKYFNPAFHSMTPEGFNARCTFLQQCTRQGNTKTMSDLGGKTANNLAFGRPPYCVLRLGDFYYQMIVIDNISFDYNIAEGIQWDMNTEGNGVQPMLCKVNISFKFIGGGDITGPVQRLQNAMSFNYYANASFYDNRADRVQYQPTNWATMGGAGNNNVDTSKSYAYIAKLYEESGPNFVTPVINEPQTE